MMWFFFWPLALVVFGLMFFGRRHLGVGCGWQHDAYTQTPPAAGPDPVEIVRQRLARGEITPEQYAEIRRVLG